MSIWKSEFTLKALNQLCRQTMVEHLNIQFTEFGDDYLVAEMSVDQRTIQPDKLLHGGASVALAETLGSVGANLCIDREKKRCVGLSINASHVRSVRDGKVSGTARPLHIGATTQLWEIKINNEKGSLVCICRLTMVVLDKK